MMIPLYIVVHTAGSADEDGYPVHQSFETVRDYHVRENGWSDIGYHGYIEEDGSFREGLSLTKPGAHVEGLNYKSLGICCSGHGDLEQFNQAQFVTLLQKITEWQTLFEIPIGRVLGHRETYTIPGVPNKGKTCPGLQNDMHYLRNHLVLWQQPRPEPMLATVPSPVPVLTPMKGPVMPETVRVQKKPWWQSKTNWVGAAQIVAGVAELLTASALIGGEAAGVVATVGGAAMIFMRFLTGAPLTTSKQG